MMGKDYSLTQKFTGSNIQWESLLKPSSTSKSSRVEESS